MDSAKVFLQLFYWVVLIACSALLFYGNYFWASLVRDILMPILMAYLIISLKPTHSKMVRVYFILALSFLWISDILGGFINMDYEEATITDPFLYASMIGYCIANIFYVFAFSRIKKIAIANCVKSSFVILLGIIFIYIVYFWFISASKIQGYKPLFIVLSLTQFAVGAMAANITDSNTKKKLAFNYFLPAAGMAIMSIAIFVINRYFLKEARLESVAALTYGYAQFMNINGFRKTSR